jgi:hypothetical protein
MPDAVLTPRRTSDKRDVPLILHFTKELAAYEKLANRVTATEAEIRRVATLSSDKRAFGKKLR